MSAKNKHFPKILIFDSGIGGLSVSTEIRQRLPQCQIIYTADNHAYPYGTQNENDLVERVLGVLPLLEKKFSPHVIVIACNSASTLVLDKVRSQTRTPVIGVVPAIKPAARASRTGILGLLATPGTVERRYTRRLIDEFAADCTVIKVGSNKLVHLAEELLRGKVIDNRAVETILAPFFDASLNNKLDTIILGCTHFPFLKQTIRDLIPKTVTLIDSGEAIAKRTGHILESVEQVFDPAAIPESHYFVFTARKNDIEELMPVIQSQGFNRIHFL